MLKDWIMNRGWKRTIFINFKFEKKLSWFEGQN